MAMTVLAAAAHFLGYRYATRSADNCVPVVRDFLPAGLEQNGPRLVDCSTFMAALAAYVFAGTVDWDAEAYEDMQVMDASDLWSVVACWVRHGLGSRVPTGLNSQGRETVLEPPQGWAFFQAWVDEDDTETDGDPISGGHQFAYHGGLGIRIHSTSRGALGPVVERVAWEDLVSYYAHGIQGVELRDTL